MALIPSVGRKTLKMRLIIAALYIVLTLGAFTMIYPFALMLGSSITSGADVNSYSVVPKYMYDETALFPKFAEDRYNGDIEIINGCYGTDFAKIDNVVQPKVNPKLPGVRKEAEDWNHFIKSLPLSYKECGFVPYNPFAPSKLRVAYRAFCRKRFGNDIGKLNKIYGEENDSFELVNPPLEQFKMREWTPGDSPKMKEWLAFKAKLPADSLRPILTEPAYQSFLKDNVYEGSIQKLNTNWKTDFKNFKSIHLPVTVPQQPGQAADWEKYVRTMMPFRYMRVSPEARPVYQAFLNERYKGNIQDLNTRHNAAYGSFAQIDLPAIIPTSGAPLVDWMDFIAKRVPLTMLRAVNTENLYREHLQKDFGTIDGVNKAFGTKYASFLDAAPPVYRADWVYVSQHAKSMRMNFLTRNYASVFNYIVLHGRAVLNTFIFVLAVILTHLIVNPMCAYALSRYNLPYAYKVLLFLLATMAFPAEVAMIPSFLLLKQFHLLNTYWALILPGMANGYSIFLLKGFFDSLPKELYEAGIIDGASEGIMFRKITVPMSKPIFAVIALQAFTGAYGAFMYAMLVCQDPKMWTIMVWLYQLQTQAPQYIIMSALTMAALPTLFVFIFAQNVIMRGIIIPSFK